MRHYCSFTMRNLKFPIFKFELAFDPLKQHSEVPHFFLTVFAFLLAAFAFLFSAVPSLERSSMDLESGMIPQVSNITCPDQHSGVRGR